MKVGEFVRTYFDTGGKFGMAIVYGKVIAAGPKAFRVQWESGNTNRIRRDEPGGVKGCPKEELDGPALRRLGVTS